jgi:hypothetical protein
VVSLELRAALALAEAFRRTTASVEVAQWTGLGGDARTLRERNADIAGRAFWAALEALAPEDRKACTAIASDPEMLAKVLAANATTGAVPSVPQEPPPAAAPTTAPTTASAADTAVSTTEPATAAAPDLVRLLIRADVWARVAAADQIAAHQRLNRALGGEWVELSGAMHAGPLAKGDVPAGLHVLAGELGLELVEYPADADPPAARRKAKKGTRKGAAKDDAAAT